MKTILLSSTPGIDFKEKSTPPISFYPHQTRRKTRPVLTYGRKPWLYVSLKDESDKVKDMLELNQQTESEDKLVKKYRTLAKEVKSSHDQASVNNDNEFDKAAKRFFAKTKELRPSDQSQKKMPEPPPIIPVAGLGNISLAAADASAPFAMPATPKAGKKVEGQKRKKSTLPQSTSSQGPKRQKKTTKEAKPPHFKISKA